MITRIYHALAKRYAPSGLKRRIWDQEYQSGQWDTSGRPADAALAARDPVLEAIDRYAGGGGILDLGCGSGLTALEITNFYSKYVGVDISENAVKRAAEEMARHPERAGKTSFVAADIARYAPAEAFKLILFRESIYYFPVYQVRRILRRYSLFLAPEGVFVARLHDRQRYRGIVSLIETKYKVVERLVPPGYAGVVLVFRPR